MNTCKISYDGRVTFWNTRLQSIQRPETTPQVQSAEGRLFFSLCEEGKRRWLLSGLGLSHVLISDGNLKPSPRAVRGSKGISVAGKALVRQGCQWLEDEFGVKNLSFLTCTLPESALAAYTPQSWAEVVNRFLKALRRRLVRAKLSIEIVGCIELQPGRLLKSQGQPTAHLHLVFQGRKVGGQWAYRPESYRASWERACKSVWADAQGFGQSTRVESIRVSSVSYMGKYLSKGGKILASLDPMLLPRAWYTMSSSLKALVKRLEFRVSGEAAYDLYYWLKNHEFLTWVREVWSGQCADGSYFLMAWIGAIKARSKYWEIVGGMRELVKRRSEVDAPRFSEISPFVC